MEQAPTAVSRTELNTWQRCPRQWLVKYYYGLVPADPVPTGAANFGIRWHTAMECFYGHGLDLLEAIDWIYHNAIQDYPDFEPELRKDWDMSKIMAEGYLEWLAAEGKDADLEVIAAEHEVRVPLPGFEGLVDLRAKMDLVVRSTQTGLLSFLDHKTADNFKRHEITEMDPQMASYSLIQWLASGQPVPQLGRPAALRDDVPLVNGGIVRTARRVKRTAKSNPPYYDQAEFRFDQDQMAATLLSTQAVVKEILSARNWLDEASEVSAWDVQVAQLSACRPTKILYDCSWSCPFSSGLCQLMDAGTTWMEAIVSSGRYVQADPYEYYSRPDASRIAELIG